MKVMIFSGSSGLWSGFWNRYSVETFRQARQIVTAHFYTQSRTIQRIGFTPRTN